MVEALQFIGGWFNLGVAAAGAVISLSRLSWWLIRQIAIQLRIWQWVLEYVYHRKEFRKWLREGKAKP